MLKDEKRIKVKIMTSEAVFSFDLFGREATL